MCMTRASTYGKSRSPLSRRAQGSESLTHGDRFGDASYWFPTRALVMPPGQPPSTRLRRTGDLLPGARVRVKSDEREVRALQPGHGG
jgi:hypothetical protein